MLQFFDQLGLSIDIITIILFIIVLIVIFYGTNFQGWLARRQILRVRHILTVWKKHGIRFLHQIIVPICPETITAQDIDVFIEQMLNFFVISPSDLDSPYFPKVNFLLMRRHSRYRDMIRTFLPKIDDGTLAKLISVLLATAELDQLLKKIRHHLIIGRRTKSTWYIMQVASDMTQNLLTAKAYHSALSAFMNSNPIGDSIGPLAVKEFIQEIVQKEPEYQYPAEINITDTMIAQEILFEQRLCICLRTKGPESTIGNPGFALEKTLELYATKSESIKLIITIDAMKRLEGEESGVIAQGLGLALGSGENDFVDKYKIESIAISHNPPIPIETIVCKQSLEESVTAMNEIIRGSVPRILQILKQTLRTQVKANEAVIIIGVGNALGIK